MGVVWEGFHCFVTGHCSWRVGMTEDGPCGTPRESESCALHYYISFWQLDSSWVVASETLKGVTRKDVTAVLPLTADYGYGQAHENKSAGTPLSHGLGVSF